MGRFTVVNHRPRGRRSRKGCAFPSFRGRGNRPPTQRVDGDRRPRGRPGDPIRTEPKEIPGLFGSDWNRLIGEKGGRPGAGDSRDLQTEPSNNHGTTRTEGGFSKGSSAVCSGSVCRIRTRESRPTKFGKPHTTSTVSFPSVQASQENPSCKYHTDEECTHRKCKMSVASAMVSTCGILVAATFVAQLQSVAAVQPVSPILEEYLLKVFDNLEDSSEQRSSFVEDAGNFFYSDTRGDNGQCKPADIYEDMEDVDQLCRNMRSKNFRSFLEPYEEAYPMKPEVPRGCYLGCPVSSSIQANFFVRQTEGLGRWVGKCFDPDNMIVANLIQAPVIGIVPAFKGALYVERSWMNETNNAWIIDYRGTPRQFGRDFTVYRDEFRFVDEGVILGHMYARPFTTTNPLPFGVNARVPFMLHQICDEELEKRALPSLA
eukprot:scaffold576_cov336-Pavlova_lutheri.AAC.4